MKITGIVFNKDKNPEPFTKVFISDFKGVITPKKIGSVTDENGKFELDITNKDDIYLTAKTSIGEQSITKIKDDVSDYSLYLDVDRGQNLKEVVITAKRQEKKPNISVDTSKYKKRITIALIILGAIIVVGGTIYIVKKQKN
jgi:hypothetical protein